ncbi:MAG: ABC transporter ATP-binding protein [Thermoguttaceae bacterium]|nr:ABC transporter ATP-binding protein [Thermoguttaceae bacterium]
MNDETTLEPTIQPEAGQQSQQSDFVPEGHVFVSEDGTRKVLRRRQPLLEVEGMSVTFGTHAVLHDINLRVRRGETIAIIGESGCGKTVLLKTMIGLIWPTSGDVRFEGKSLSKMSSRELVTARSKYGFVFQQAALFDSMTVGDNVAFAARQNKTKMNRQQMKNRVAYLLEEVGLNPNIVGQMPAELSGGMRKRVGFARALMMEPELMLYDEPTTGLDPIMSDVINELIISARDNHHVTGILVTHDMKSARKVADRVIMLYPHSRLVPGEPQIIFDGPPSQLDHSPDPRVTQFVNGEAGERVMEMAARHGTENRSVQENE